VTMSLVWNMSSFFSKQLQTNMFLLAVLCSYETQSCSFNHHLLSTPMLSAVFSQ
jgi:hypothetical protein